MYDFYRLITSFLVVFRFKLLRQRVAFASKVAQSYQICRDSSV